ncbi:MAG: cytochrome c-type biogenesis protein [Candidatus Aquirickettsiella sp.]
MLCWTVLFSPLAFSELSETYVFDSVQKKNQFEAIIHEMRCLVCQNQNLADSNAPLANDLRLVIYRRITQGESTGQIRSYLVSRYGTFISFKPVFSRLTYCLWLSPFILLLAILLTLFIKIKKRTVQISHD